jgi:hypothetical protein
MCRTQLARVAHAPGRRREPLPALAVRLHLQILWESGQPLQANAQYGTIRLCSASRRLFAASAIEGHYGVMDDRSVFVR